MGWLCQYVNTKVTISFLYLKRTFILITESWWFEWQQPWSTSSHLVCPCQCTLKGKSVIFVPLTQSGFPEHLPLCYGSPAPNSQYWLKFKTWILMNMFTILFFFFFFYTLFKNNIYYSEDFFLYNWYHYVKNVEINIWKYFLHLEILQKHFV